jgi:hypothetical protein
MNSFAVGETVLDFTTMNKLYISTKVLVNDDDVPFIYFDHKIHDSLVTTYTEELFTPGCYPERLPAKIVEEIYYEVKRKKKCLKCLKWTRELSSAE